MPAENSPASPNETKLTPKQRIAQLEAENASLHYRIGNCQTVMLASDRERDRLHEITRRQDDDLRGLMDELARTNEKLQSVTEARDAAVDKFQALRCAILDYFMAKDSGNVDAMAHARKHVVENVITRVSI